MTCKKCNTDFVFEWENSPGYVCLSCGDTRDACMVCEEPCRPSLHGEKFCSEVRNVVRTVAALQQEV